MEATMEAVTLQAAGVVIGGLCTSIVIPAILSAAGFCSTGVALASFASWWQSTFPLVPKGSLFSQLQSLSMGGSGVTIIAVAGALIGSVAAGRMKKVIDDAFAALRQNPLGWK
jgi:hypothetical protein